MKACILVHFYTFITNFLFPIGVSIHRRYNLTGDQSNDVHISDPSEPETSSSMPLKSVKNQPHDPAPFDYR